MTKEIRQFPEVTAPVTTDWFMIQKSSNNQTSKVAGSNVKSAISGLGNSNLGTTAGDLGGAYLAWTPTFNLAGGTSWGNATFSGSYTIIGTTCHFKAMFTLGSTTNFAGLTGITINLPVAAAAILTTQIIGNVMCTGYIFGRLGLISTTAASVWFEVSSGSYVGAADITSAIPRAWTNTNYCTVSGAYEIA